jgi:hypothetical protein
MLGTRFIILAIFPCVQSKNQHVRAPGIGTTLEMEAEPRYQGTIWHDRLSFDDFVDRALKGRCAASQRVERNILHRGFKTSRYLLCLEIESGPIDRAIG